METASRTRSAQQKNPRPAASEADTHHGPLGAFFRPRQEPRSSSVTESQRDSVPRLENVTTPCDLVQGLGEALLLVPRAATPPDSLGNPAAKLRWVDQAAEPLWIASDG